MFVKCGVSGSVPFAERPEGGRLLRQLQAGDIVISPKLDRVFRSSLDALHTIEELKRRKVSLWLLDLGGDVEQESGKPMLVPARDEQAAIERMRAMRHDGSTLFAIRDARR